MSCSSCGSENPEEMKFCGECGTLLMNRCPSCGFENPPEFKFCGECATPLGRDSQLAVSVSPQEEPAEVALNLAKEWTRSSIDNVSNMLGLAVTAGTPALHNIASSLIGNQFKKNVEWTCSDPENVSGDNCRVIATCSAPLEVGLLAFKWRSTASADFELSIDTAAKEILWWQMVPKSLKVIPSQETDKIRERVGEEVDKVKGLFQDFFKR